MYAIIETGGKQYQVKEGDVLFVEKLDAEDTVKFEKVLAVSADAGLTVGAPYVDGASVDAKVLAQGKGKKVIVFKMKPKKGYRNKTGHRQPYTKIEIAKINA